MTYRLYTAVKRFRGGGTSTREVWLAKKQPDGSFLEIPGSKVGFVVSKDYRGAKHISSGKIKVDIKKGDSIRVLFKSDLDDGVYLESISGQTLLRINIDFNELGEIDQRIIDLIQKGK